ncbi:MAG: DUF1592 domain-containing protein [Planctomycetota bacterium]|jgi:hypothetical protein
MSGPEVFASAPPAALEAVIENHCVDCHDDAEAKGGLDFYALDWDLADPHVSGVWVNVHDKLRSGEMPPKKRSRISDAEREAAVVLLADRITRTQEAAFAKDGRAVSRRVNRFEYENALRDLLGDPYLKVADRLPLDGEVHGFAKVGEALDVSHVQVDSYLDAAEFALRRALEIPAERPAVKVERYHAREQSRMWNGAGNGGWGRRSLALDGLEINEGDSYSNKRFTAGELPAYTDDDSVAIFNGAYTPFYYAFNRFSAPVNGRYRLRIKARSVLRQTDYVDWEGEKKPRFYPSLVLDVSRRFPTPVNDRVFPGKRSEPVKVYTSTDVEPNKQNTLPVGVFHAPPHEPGVFELEAHIDWGANVQLDIMRIPTPMLPALPHTIQKSEPEGYPGVAFHWLEVEGPLVERWPPAPYRALFDDLPVEQDKRSVVAATDRPREDAGRLLRRFMERAYRRPVATAEFERFHRYALSQLEAGESFTEAMIATYAGVLASPEFLFHCARPGELDDHALAERLAFFLGESAPDDTMRGLARSGRLRKPVTLRAEVDRLLAKPEASRFVNRFLDSWLKLDEINDTDPDRELYPEYAGDWWLVNSMVAESRVFFADLIANDRPARNVIDTDYAFVDERMARHYSITGVLGTGFRRVPLSEESPYGGMMTQASVLKVTANGTVTSPVLRGVYVMERFLGDPPPPPPPAVPAVEPDIRGAATIRELLAKHREDPACAGCHRKIDPPGFALESFDVMGHWRDNYRSLTRGSERVEGVGRSGNEFVHYIAQDVDASGQTAAGEPFDDVVGFKKLLLKDEEKIARNLLEQLVVYATGAPIRFADRDEVAAILENSRASGYGVRTLIHEIVQSPLFLRK